MRLLPFAAIALLLPACADWPGQPEEEFESGERAAGACGTERWSVKVGTDGMVSQVNLTPQDTTIPALTALTAPATLPDSSRISPTELQAVRLKDVTVVRYKLESDSDYHIVLWQGGVTLISEIPDPACVGSGSPFNAGVLTTRASFNSKYTPNGTFQNANVYASVTGVPFFDFIHNPPQSGVAANGIELHPLLSICWGKGCADPPDGGGVDAGPTPDAGPVGDGGGSDGGHGGGGGNNSAPPGCGCGAGAGSGLLGLAALLRRRR